MKSVPVGTQGSHSVVARREHLAGAFAPSLPPVFATCMMSLMMELAAMEALKPYLEPGEITLGIGMNVRHLGATPEGNTVTAFAEVTKVEGRRIEFKVWARDEHEEVGSGTHLRALASREEFDRRWLAKVKPT